MRVRVRVLEIIYIDQEHELVFCVGTINLTFEPLNKMDV
jgi:hypothetical protein